MNRHLICAPEIFLQKLKHATENHRDRVGRPGTGIPDAGLPPVGGEWARRIVGWRHQPARRDTAIIAFVSSQGAHPGWLGKLTPRRTLRILQCELHAHARSADLPDRELLHERPCHGARKGRIMNVKIYHNPNCGTSRKVLALLREQGYEPDVVEYLKTPPTRDELKSMIESAGLTVRE